MNHPPHLALVVEDEAETAADLVDVLKTCGCEARVATNRHDALVQLDSTSFCIILLDLQIGSEPDSIRGRIEYGKAVLTEARRRFPDRFGTTHALPIVVVSGVATEPDAAVEAMRDGASDVVQKLSDAKSKADRIYAALEKSGRASHRRCQELSSASTLVDPSGRLTLSIPAKLHGRRVAVMLGKQATTLTAASLKVLLHLVKARLSTGWVHKNDLGGSEDRGFKGISVLRSELEHVCSGETRSLIVNDQHGRYGLAETVSVGELNFEGLEALEDRKITTLVREIRNLLAEKAKSDGNI